MEEKTFELCDIDAIVALKDVETAIKKTRDSFERANAVFKKFTSKVDTESRICGSDMLDLLDVDGVKKLEIEVLQELYHHVGIITQCLFKTSYISSITMQTVDRVLAELNQDWSIEVAEIDGSVVVKTPPLLNYFTSKIYVKGVQRSKSYSNIFANEVHEKMKEKFPEYIDISEKTVALLAVYPTSCKLVPDTNNLDVKSIIDAITCFYIGGDSACSCSFVSMSIKNDAIKEGCYFVVYDSFGKPVSLGELVEKASKVGLKKSENNSETSENNEVKK